MQSEHSDVAMGSQSGKKNRGGGGGGGSSGSGGGGGGSGGGGSGSSIQQKIDQLIHDKKFNEAAAIGVGTAAKFTGADLLVDATLAGVKGYQEAKKHGIQSGVTAAATDFAKSQSIGGTSDIIANVAVNSVPGLNTAPVAKEIVRDAVSSAVDELIQGRLGV